MSYLSSTCHATSCHVMSCHTIVRLNSSLNFLTSIFRSKYPTLLFPLSSSLPLSLLPLSSPLLSPLSPHSRPPRHQYTTITLHSTLYTLIYLILPPLNLSMPCYSMPCYSTLFSLFLISSLALHKNNATPPITSHTIPYHSTFFHMICSLCFAMLCYVFLFHILTSFFLSTFTSDILLSLSELLLCLTFFFTMLFFLLLCACQY